MTGLASACASPARMDFTSVDLRIATVTAATQDGDALRLALDLGGVERHAVAHIIENYGPGDLVGTQVVVVGGAEPVVLAAVSPSQGAVVLRPDQPVANGTQVV